MGGDLPAFYQGHTIVCKPPVLCAVPSPLPVGVQTNCLAGQQVGVACMYSCKARFAPSGNGAAVCQKDAGSDPETAAYQGSTLSCAAEKTCPIPAAETGIKHDCPDNGSTTAPTKCTFSCVLPYVARPGGGGASVCRMGGAGGLEPGYYQGHTLVCVPPVSCPVPTGLGIKVVTNCVKDKGIGTQCKMSCEAPYAPASGTGDTVCTGAADGMSATYQGHTIVCAPPCPIPTPLGLGVVTSCVKNIIGTQCKMTCQAPYTPASGTGDTVCKGAGAPQSSTYQGHTLACAPPCPAPTGLSPGIFTTCIGDRPIGTTCEMSCKTGYVCFCCFCCCSWQWCVLFVLF